jgi:predicted DNA-binding transcriptional regulator AlpA
MDRSETEPRRAAPLRGDMWTAAQVGERLNLSEKTIYSWRAARKLPIDYFYINRNLRFDSADVDDYISLSRREFPKVRFDPNLIEAWLERMESRIAGVRKIVKRRFCAGAPADAWEEA